MNILHNVLITNEIVDIIEREKKKRRMIFKVDYENDYDSVS